MSPERERRPSRPQRGRPAPRKQGPRRPPPYEDPARRAAFEVLRAVRERDAYANLVLPEMLRQRRLAGRDAALATELTYGASRAQGLLDEIIGACLDRPLSQVDGVVLDCLRLGAYQLLRTRIPEHAAVDAMVNMARLEGGSHVAGFVNAVLRKVSEKDEAAWLDELAPDPGTDPIGNLALRTAHPRWVARSFAEALGDKGPELEAALKADDARPAVHLVARPGEISADELAAITGGDVAPYSPYGVHLPPGAGDPGDLEPIREKLAAVQDEGSQLCAVALSRVPVEGSDERWLDLCAGPGGKAALLGALAAISGARVDAVEQAPHRARLVEKATEGLPVTVHVADGREPDLEPGYDRVLVDAPCSGLGSLRRRPESRWRRKPSDVADLTKLQSQLLASALELVRPGGVVAYVVCSPHLAETEGVAGDAARRSKAEVLDAREFFPGVPQLGDGPFVQLWPHRHGTDAMFCALLRRP
ncbi:RsmB/NOP family class I SAM-dependent RNA methyltransferase [Amycolatopsis acidiphila]|uniref:RsmB/NOP family class I SAM-dependent RNA methyltransferase n=1 Tax=Amycolatopsis acidiphila TaxID=715473 RepID=A0A558A250_9PSEU|nr:RsmB/NOP family class I SAM-dependent RNA methyltransferase [Amycolatopsis acidiphila]TVT18339.1 RsmB/NOP family class I SAM-dependent RNA methyltransferase [Amycolatopsis acidiphila]UIJ56713.1 RsmB/NOP family class I SAM-dependent RNA methyltransferase [Amycolatopsis acidiphila]GHG55596.1 methyltransferase [Amycolatopsis acidiphila]